jgi:hypothetical protein
MKMISKCLAASTNFDFINKKLKSIKKDFLLNIYTFAPEYIILELSNCHKKIFVRHFAGAFCFEQHAYNLPALPFCKSQRFY